MTTIPYKPLCLLSLFVIIGVAYNAFEEEYQDPCEVLHPKGQLDEGIQYTPIAWKEGMLDKRIAPISYHQYWSIWNRVNTVSGMRDRVRPYSMRVGAGQRLDGRIPLMIFASSPG